LSRTACSRTRAKVPAGLAADDLHSLPTTIASRNDGGRGATSTPSGAGAGVAAPPTGTRRRPPLGFCHEVGPLPAPLGSGATGIASAPSMKRTAIAPTAAAAIALWRGQGNHERVGAVIVVVLLVLLGSPQT